MLVEFVSEILKENSLAMILAGIFGSYLVTSQSLPFIIYFSKVKNLTAKVDERSSHTSNIPNIGGIGIIAGIYIVTLSLSFFILNYEESKFIIALFISLLILLFVGFKDDMLGLSAIAKLLTEIGTATAFILLTDCRLDNFYGLFGIYELNYFVSIILSIFIFVVTINSYNLIDGIDGLAGGYGIIAMIAFLFLSLSANNLVGLILCATIIGSLAGFLKFNLSNSKRKIFMGDTGSLVVGFLISVTALITLSSNNDYSQISNNIPVLVLSILSFPYVDTLRVMVIRRKNKQKFFKPDKNHIHHKLINAGKSHVSSSIIILAVYLSSILFCILFHEINITIHFIISLLYSLLSLLTLVFIFDKK
ncbi:undecaprenyl/decaprenyl-phosphate alpha-N-acetylglucosaminyl 1-phosphate transferase [Bacteroidota bacterium]|nr:undecaprenyl/decaprenyl-phosphate alpha-N-acetylglucosaminyl 1-phosphate transferase [Bacteroidota bacterium]MDC3114837.1 undecaprenyl/decaprenyl-phosphate alpha-N-acetylglucosaminyl 1-phosphate transferase [Bacteroidota bacterium]